MANEAELDDIRAWVAAGGKIGVDNEGNPVVPAAAVANVANVANVPDAANATTPEAVAPTRAAKASARKAAAAARGASGEEEQDQPQGKHGTQGKQEQSVVGRGVRDLFGRAVDWAARLPTPGGVFALFLILLFFAWAVIPVNHGATRIQLIWLVLTGNADLMNQPDTSQGSSNDGKWWGPILDPNLTQHGASTSGAQRAAVTQGTHSGGGPDAPTSNVGDWRADDLAPARGFGL